MFHVLAGLYQSTLMSSATILVLGPAGHPTYVVQNSTLRCRPTVVGASAHIYQHLFFSNCLVTDRAQMSRDDRYRPNSVTVPSDPMSTLKITPIVGWPSGICQWRVAD